MTRWRDLSLAGRSVALLVTALAVGLGLMLLSRWWDGLWSWLPWSQEARLGRAEAELDQAEADLAARKLELDLKDKQAQAVQTANDTLIQVRTATERAVTQAQGAPDAAQPVDTDRLERLRGADRRLCALAPVACADQSAED